MYSTEILLNTATIRQVNSTKTDSTFTATETQDYAPLQRQPSNNSHSFKTIEFTYSDFPCGFKVNRDYLALTNRRLMCKKDKRLTITGNSQERKLRSGKKSGPCAVS